jgi:hypothetical protein
MTSTSAVLRVAGNSAILRDFYVLDPLTSATENTSGIIDFNEIGYPQTGDGILIDNVRINNPGDTDNRNAFHFTASASTNGVTKLTMRKIRVDACGRAGIEIKAESANITDVDIDDFTIGSCTGHSFSAAISLAGPIQRTHIVHGNIVGTFGYGIEAAATGYALSVEDVKWSGSITNPLSVTDSGGQVDMILTGIQSDSTLLNSTWYVHNASAVRVYNSLLYGNVTLNDGAYPVTLLTDEIHGDVKIQSVGAWISDTKIITTSTDGRALNLQSGTPNLISNSIIDTSAYTGNATYPLDSDTGTSGQLIGPGVYVCKGASQPAMASAAYTGTPIAACLH